MRVEINRFKNNVQNYFLRNQVMIRRIHIAFIIPEPVGELRRAAGRLSVTTPLKACPRGWPQILKPLVCPVPVPEAIPPGAWGRHSKSEGFILYVVFIFFVWRKPNGKMRLRSPRPGGAQRRGCDRFHLGPFESETQPDPSALCVPNSNRCLSGVLTTPARIRKNESEHIRNYE